VRDRFKLALHGDRAAKLTKGQEVGAGIVGGTLACWNHPIEVVRIEAQASGFAGAAPRSVPTILGDIVRAQGVSGLFKGIVPRVFLGCWQTLCMVTGERSSFFPSVFGWGMVGGAMRAPTPHPSSHHARHPYPSNKNNAPTHTPKATSC
jgi:hypothetical protein